MFNNSLELPDSRRLSSPSSHTLSLTKQVLNIREALSSAQNFLLSHQFTPGLGISTVLEGIVSITILLEWFLEAAV